MKTEPPPLRRQLTAEHLGVTQEALDELKSDQHRLANGSFGAVYRMGDVVFKVETSGKIPTDMVRATLDSVVSGDIYGDKPAHVVALSHHTFGEDRIITKMPYKGKQTIKDAHIDVQLGVFAGGERGSVEICKKLTDQLAKTHARGIAHRDIKPENILFQVNGEGTDYQLHLIDALPSGRLNKTVLFPLMAEAKQTIMGSLSDDPEFYQTMDEKNQKGHSRVGRELLAAVTNTVGTVRYLSPETASNILKLGKTGPATDSPLLASDIFSLGITMLELVSGADKVHYDNGEPANLGVYDNKYAYFLKQLQGSEVVVDESRVDKDATEVIVDFVQVEKDSNGKDRKMVVSIPASLELKPELVSLFGDMLQIQPEARPTVDEISTRLGAM